MSPIAQSWPGGHEMLDQIQGKDAHEVSANEVSNVTNDTAA
jgi:hypothetical protein